MEPISANRASEFFGSKHGRTELRLLLSSFLSNSSKAEHESSAKLC